MDYVFAKTAHALKQAILHKHIGIEELVAAYISRIEKFGCADGLNAVCEINEHAIAQARHMDSIGNKSNLPIYGIPVLVKDNIDVEGLHTTAGSLALSDNIALRDADVVGI